MSYSSAQVSSQAKNISLTSRENSCKVVLETNKRSVILCPGRVHANVLAKFLRQDGYHCEVAPGLVNPENIYIAAYYNAPF